MRQPLWLLNLLLLLILIFALVFMFSSKIKIPQKKSLFVQEYEDEKQDVSTEKGDASIIYEKDLFGTLKSKPIKEPEVKKEAVPTPPKKITPVIPKPTPVKFLEPLPITLTGIIFFDDKHLNRAIILDNRDKKESIYKFEDEIEDAQIIKIQKDRVLLLRSNGQQETIYLKQEINNLELNTLTINWKALIEKKDSSNYRINKDKFLQEVKSLSDLIFKLDLKTAIKNQEPIGLSVGQVEKDSLADSIGLSSGDIIIDINDMPLKTQSDRLAAYNNIVEENPRKIIIKVKSADGVKDIAYLLSEPDLDRSNELKNRIRNSGLNSNEIAINHQKYNDTLKDIKLHDKQNMFKYKSKAN